MTGTGVRDARNSLPPSARSKRGCGRNVGGRRPRSVRQISAVVDGNRRGREEPPTLSLAARHLLSRAVRHALRRVVTYNARRPSRSLRPTTGDGRARVRVGQSKSVRPRSARSVARFAAADALGLPPSLSLLSSFSVRRSLRRLGRRASPRARPPSVFPRRPRRGVSRPSGVRDRRSPLGDRLRPDRVRRRHPPAPPPSRPFAPPPPPPRPPSASPRGSLASPRRRASCNSAGQPSPAVAPWRLQTRRTRTIRALFCGRSVTPLAMTLEAPAMAASSRRWASRGQAPEPRLRRRRRGRGSRRTRAQRGRGDRRRAGVSASLARSLGAHLERHGRVRGGAEVGPGAGPSGSRALGLDGRRGRRGRRGCRGCRARPVPHRSPSPPPPPRRRALRLHRLERHGRGRADGRGLGGRRLRGPGRRRVRRRVDSRMISLRT